MLELRGIRKSYTTGDFTQVALDDVSISFRDNEFVAVLGPSGSGKTTMLNVIGGLDHYDSGNLIIDGVETSRYKDRDWDTYRNNRIGFVFQSYNLIPHQSVLANVELALTLAGVSPAERRRRAMEALEEVGLGAHAPKRPNQLSGGQMQRVAIARALINDPEILLADEPTGALDSTTSVAIMALLTEIARDRLVIMVTHNPELADQYATRIVSLRDGVIVEDTDPSPEGSAPAARKDPSRRTSMSFLTAIALSFNNLMTKKGRTLMTSFAGSIGIIGIAAILALANGVNAYIKAVEEDTLSLYPLTIQRQGMDMTAMLSASAGLMEEAGGRGGDGSADVHEVQVMGKMFSSVGTNDLRSLKSFIESGDSGLGAHVNSIQYAYDVTPQIFATDDSGGVRRVNPDNTFAAIGFGSSSSASSLMSSMGTSVFAELTDDRSLVEEHFDVVAGDWPTAYDEAVVVLTPSGGISDFALYAMGLRDPAELDEMVRRITEEESVTPPSDPLQLSYDELLGVDFALVDAADLYTYDDEFGVWTDRSGDDAFVSSVAGAGDRLRITGVVRPTDDSSRLAPGIYYTRALTTRVVERAARSPIVQRQLADPAVDVFTGRGFGEEPDEDELDLSSLLSIDEDAIAEAFTFDESRLEVDLPSLDGALLGGDLGLSGLTLDPARLPALELDEVLAGLDLSSLIRIPDDGGDGATQEPAPTPDLDQITQTTTRLFEGYLSFAAAGGLDPADVATNLPAFLAAPEGEALLADLGEGIAAESLTPLVEGYLTFAEAQGVDPADLTANLPAFLATPEGAALLEPFTPAQSSDPGLAGRAVEAYLAFTVANGLDPIDAATSFPAFLESPEGRALLGEAAGYIDTSALEAQLQTVLGDYLGEVINAYMGEVTSQLSSVLTERISSALEESMGQLAQNMAGAMGIDQDAFMDAFQLERNQEELTQLLVSMASRQSASYESNLRALGWADFDNPARIDIYPVDFEAKAEVIGILDSYNEQMRAAGEEDSVITYTDLVGALMSSVTDIVNMISYVLIAFVAISLVVSSIMIGVITYISVLERRKEIGILRSIGASKRDIRRVFNAETLIVGFVAGALGVAITFLITIPANAIVYSRFDVANIAQLPWQAAGILVLISMALTALAGLIPASAASRKDPVEALRSE